jgi:hypothetical protein
LLNASFQEASSSCPLLCLEPEKKEEEEEEEEEEKVILSWIVFLLVDLLIQYRSYK